MTRRANLHDFFNMLSFVFPFAEVCLAALNQKLSGFSLVHLKVTVPQSIQACLPPAINDTRACFSFQLFAFGHVLLFLLERSIPGRQPKKYDWQSRAFQDAARAIFGC